MIRVNTLGPDEPIGFRTKATHNKAEKLDNDQAIDST